MNFDEERIIALIKDPKVLELAALLGMAAAKLTNEPENNHSFYVMMTDPVFIAACNYLEKAADDSRRCAHT